ncbi:MAG: chromate efflux transporter [Akkermansiaceae bacterium]
MKQVWECFVVALRLGLTSFGGPVAHVGYFREEYVERRKWLSEERFGELTALSQFIPGPGSSQLGAAVGYEKGGLAGGFAAWLGFTLPSALVMLFVAMGVESLSGGVIHGMKLVAIAVVAGAWLGMRASLATGFRRGGIALLAVVILWFSSAAWMTVLVIAFCAFLGVLFLNVSELPERQKQSRKLGGVLAMIVFFALLFWSLGFQPKSDSHALAGIYRAGALVFGGGHVVLPMLQETMVDSGYMSKEVFLGGYGATQAVPGPVFTFASFLGGQTELFGNAWLGAGAGIVVVFLPGMLLLAGTMSVWGRLRGKAWAQKAVQGANAAVVGVLGLALIQMATNGSIAGFKDVIAVVLLFFLLKKNLVPVWALVIGAGVVGGFFA